MRRTPRIRFLAASVAACATFALAACGGDDDDTATTQAPVESGDADPTTTVAGPDTASGGSATTSGATSGGGEVGSRNEYVEGVKVEIEEDMEDPSQAECFAEAIVSDDVYAAIEEAGVTVEQFGEGPASVTIDQAQAEAIAGELAGCGELAAQLGVNEAQTACLTESLDNEQLALLVTLAAFELPPTEELTAAQADIQACVAATATTG